MVDMQIADVQDDISSVLLTKEEIEGKIKEAAALIDRDYADKNVLLLAVLKGAVNTLVALSSQLHINAQIDFMSLSSYGSGTESSGEVTIRQDMAFDVRGRHVLIVEDIVDSGLTLSWLMDLLRRRGAASVEAFALLNKPDRNKIHVDVKYPGFDIHDEFVVGFGLDYNELYRNLDSIAALKPSVYQGDHA